MFTIVWKEVSSKLIGAVYKVRPAILHGSEACYLYESEMAILRRREMSMV